MLWRCAAVSGTGDGSGSAFFCVFRVEGLEIRVLGFRVSGFWVWGLGFQDLEFGRVGFKVFLGCRVYGYSVWTLGLSINGYSIKDYMVKKLEVMFRV